MLNSKLPWVLLVALWSVAVEAEDLLTVYQQAVEADPQLKSAGFKVEVGNAQTGQALGQMLPQVVGTGNWSKNDNTLPDQRFYNRKTKQYFTKDVENSYPGTRYYVSLTQSLLDLPKFWEWRRTQAQERQFDAELIEAGQALLYNVVERYFMVLDAQDQLDFSITERTATETQLQQIKKQFAKQLVKITDVYEVEARLDQIQADIIQAESQLLTARQGLRELTNTSIESFKRLREDVEYKELEGKLEDWLEVAQSENPMLIAQRIAIEVADKDVAVQKSRHMPVVDLQLYYYDTDTGYQSSKTNHSQTQVAALNVNVPIFSGGSTMYRVSEAQSKLAISKEQNEAKLRGLIKETSETFTLSNANARRIKAAEKAVQSASKSHEAMQSGFKYGVKTMGDVLIAQQLEFKAKRELARTKYNYILNRVHFLKAIGTISEDNLTELNAWLIDR
jgi:outer membrane protein